MDLEERSLTWNRMEFPVLQAHRRRCAGEERRLVDRRIRKLVRDLARHAYRRGIQGDRTRARRDLVALLGARPWQSTALRYWVTGNRLA